MVSKLSIVMIAVNMILGVLIPVVIMVFFKKKYKACIKSFLVGVVLNMGPFYHLIDKKARKKCLEESLRVLKKGGYFVVAYIPRLYLNQMIAMFDVKYIIYLYVLKKRLLI